MKRLVAAVVLALVSSCNGSPELRGGTTLKAGTAPVGVSVGAWVPKDCRDAKGASAQRVSRIVLIKLPNGRHELVEQRAGYDSLAVKNSFSDGAELVYQVILKPEDGSIALHEFRLPSAGGPGRLSVSRRWKQVDKSHHRFQGYVQAPVLSCNLQPAAKPARQSASAEQDPRP